MGFLEDFFDKAGSEVLDIGGAYARQELLDLNKPTTKNPDLPEMPAVQAGQPIAGLTAGDPRNSDTIDFFGVPLHKGALYVAGGAVLLIVVLKVARG